MHTYQDLPADVDLQVRVRRVRLQRRAQEVLLSSGGIDKFFIN